MLACTTGLEHNCIAVTCLSFSVTNGWLGPKAGEDMRIIIILDDRPYIFLSSRRKGPALELH